METEVKKAAENISVSFIPMDKLKTTSFGIYIHTPLNEENASQNAVLPYVLKRGSRLCPDMEKSEKYLERLYGASFFCYTVKKGNDSIIAFDGEVISDEYAPGNEDLSMKMLDFVLSAVFEPVTDGGGFLEEYVYSEKKNAKDRLLSMKNDKRLWAATRLTEEMFAGDEFALPRYGTAEGIDKITAESLYRYYKDIITSSEIDIYIAGNCSKEEIENKLKVYFKAFDFKKAAMPAINIAKPAAGVNEVTDSDDVTQGKLSIGFTTETLPGDESYPALLMANSIFGGGVHSKLFNNVREKLSLAYYAASVLDKYKGWIRVDAGVEFDKFDAARGEIKAQLEELQRGNISDTELESARISVINELKSYYDDGRYIQSYYLGQKIAGTNVTLEELIDKIKSVAKEEIIEAAGRIKLHTVYFLKGRSED